MREITYEAIVSADGYFEDANGSFEWAVPDSELHAHINAQQGQFDTYVFGRRMYEVMRAWDTMAEQDLPEVEAEFARLWATREKRVASRTLADFGPGARRLEGDLVEAVAALKRQPGRGIAVGGAGIAGPLIAAGLVEVFSLIVMPVVVGGGKPYWPRDLEKIDLTLTDTHTFGGGIVQLVYRRA